MKRGISDVQRAMADFSFTREPMDINSRPQQRRKTGVDSEALANALQRTIQDMADRQERLARQYDQAIKSRNLERRALQSALLDANERIALQRGNPGLGGRVIVRTQVLGPAAKKAYANATSQTPSIPPPPPTLPKKGSHTNATIPRAPPLPTKTKVVIPPKNSPPATQPPEQDAKTNAKEKPKEKPPAAYMKELAEKMLKRRMTQAAEEVVLEGEGGEAEATERVLELLTALDRTVRRNLGVEKDASTGAWRAVRQPKKFLIPPGADKAVKANAYHTYVNKDYEQLLQSKAVLKKMKELGTSMQNIQAAFDAAGVRLK